MSRRSTHRRGVTAVVLAAAILGSLLSTVAAHAAALVNTVRPSISATASGSSCTLTAHRGSWTPAPTSYDYQWYVGGTAVSGATSRNFAMTSAHVGKVVAVRVTAARAGYTSTNVASERTAAYTTSAAWNVSPPRLSGTVAVGRAVAVDPGVWCPAVTSYTYQWLAGGAAIPGATSSTYTPTPGQVGAALSVRVTGRLAGRTPSDRTTAEVPIAPGTMVPSGVPTVTGSFAVGATVSATSPGWTPRPSGVSYQWATDGVPVSGATTPSYAIGASDLGKRITLTTTAELAGYQPSVVTSQPSSPVAAGGIAILREPALSRDPVLDKPVGVVFGSYRPADAFQRYAWHLDGVPIPGAVGASYTPFRSDLGHALSVVVTVARDGYADTIRQLPAGVVRLAPRITVRDVGLDHAARFVLRVTAGGRRATGKVEVAVGKRDKVVKLRKGRATVRLTKLKPGKKKYVVTYRGNAKVGAGTKGGKVTVRR